MSHTPIELFRRIPSGTLTDRLISFSCVKDVLMDPKRTLDRLEKLDPERKIVLF